MVLLAHTEMQLDNIDTEQIGATDSNEEEQPSHQLDERAQQRQQSRYDKNSAPTGRSHKRNNGRARRQRRKEADRQQ